MCCIKACNPTCMCGDGCASNALILATVLFTPAQKAHTFLCFGMSLTLMTCAILSGCWILFLSVLTLLQWLMPVLTWNPCQHTP